MVWGREDIKTERRAREFSLVGSQAQGGSGSSLLRLAACDVIHNGPPVVAVGKTDPTIFGDAP
jgi:hypothetical protein